MQIEMLRGDLSHEELSTQLGDVTERCLARCLAGKSFLTEDEFKAIAKGIISAGLSPRIHVSDGSSPPVCI